MARAGRRFLDNNPEYDTKPKFGDELFIPLPKVEEITIIPLGDKGFYTDGKKVYKLLEADLIDLLKLASAKTKGDE